MAETSSLKTENERSISRKRKLIGRDTDGKQSKRRRKINRLVDVVAQCPPLPVYWSSDQHPRGKGNTIKSKDTKEDDLDDEEDEYYNTPNLASMIADVTDRYTARYGVNVCWDFAESGYCDEGRDCPYLHSVGGRKKSTMRMHFGKHRGTLLHDVNVGYVRWMERNDVLSTKSPEFAAEMKWLFPDIFRE